VAVPKPFEQGNLDGLCGVYAVVNATRLAAHPHRRLRAADCYELFATLLAELADEGRLRGFVTHGLGPRVLARLLRKADPGCASATGSRSRSPGRSARRTSRVPNAACGS
jgi:hypothetical protein